MTEITFTLEQKMNAFFNALKNHVPIQFPNFVVVMIDDKLYLEMTKQTKDEKSGESKEELVYLEWEISYNDLVAEVKKLDSGEIANLAWMSAQASEHIEERKKEMSEEEFKTFFFKIQSPEIKNPTT